MKSFIYSLPLIALSLVLLSRLFAEEPTSEKSATTMPLKLDEHWRKTLTPEQYRVTREAGTERAFGKNYEIFKKQGEGTYYCVCCGAELFTSTEKFDSHCGWPSFYDASTAKNVLERVDRSAGMVRIETVCKRCDAHLGHVFEGEGFNTPTDRRFCINAVALHFVEKGGPAPELLDIDSEAVEQKKAEVADPTFSTPKESQDKSAE